MNRFQEYKNVMSKIRERREWLAKEYAKLCEMEKAAEKMNDSISVEEVQEWFRLRDEKHCE